MLSPLISGEVFKSSHVTLPHKKFVTTYRGSNFLRDQYETLMISYDHQYQQNVHLGFWILILGQAGVVVFPYKATGQKQPLSCRRAIPRQLTVVLTQSLSICEKMYH